LSLSSVTDVDECNLLFGLVMIALVAGW